MGNGCNIFDHVDLEARCLKRAERRFPAGPRAFDIDIDGSNTMLHRLFGGILRGHLGRKGSALAGTLEALDSCARPADDFSLPLWPYPPLSPVRNKKYLD